jgi:hypothetical protein
MRLEDRGRSVTDKTRTLEVPIVDRRGCICVGRGHRDHCVGVSITRPAGQMASVSLLGRLTLKPMTKFEDPRTTVTEPTPSQSVSRLLPK